MLLAYLDEFGHIGPYIDDHHPKFNDHPVFGYAGFVMPAENVRRLGSFFEHMKESLLGFEIRRADAHPRRWEKKGASLFTTKNMELYPEAHRAFKRLLRKLTELDGKVVYYGQVKPIGSEKETGESSSDRNQHHLRQALTRLSSYADSKNTNIMVVLDSTDNKPRIDAVTAMSQFIYARTSPPTLKRIVESPMQVESHLYATIQFADWLCALISRTAHHHFVPQSQFGWAPDIFGSSVAPLCTDGSKIYLPRAEPAPQGIYTRELFSSRTWADKPTVQGSSPAPTGVRIGERFPHLTQLRNELGR
mgnify:CR=1 FL=1